MIKLLTDPDITILKYPSDASRAVLLEADMSHNGCTKPILTWKGIIIDGHKRHEICSRLGLPFTVTQKDFYSKNEAILYACEQEFEQENLPAAFQKYLLGKMVQASIALAWDKFIATNPQVQPDDNGNYSICCINRSVILSDIIAKYGKKKSSLYAYRDYAEQIDVIRKKEPKLARIILTEQIQISLENVTEISRLPADEVRNIYSTIESENITKVTHSHVIYGKMRKRSIAAPPAAKRTEEKHPYSPKIKEMPIQDPDAELKSLTFTIPSWMGSIQRARERTNLSTTTEEARQKLDHQLAALSFLAEQLRKQITAGGNNHNG
jgi:hypothetical protein